MIPSKLSNLNLEFVVVENLNGVTAGFGVVMIGLNPNSNAGVKFKLDEDFVDEGFEVVVINLGPGDPPLGLTIGLSSTLVLLSSSFLMSCL